MFQNARSVLRHLHFSACDPRCSVELDFTRLSGIESRSVWLDTIPLQDQGAQRQRAESTIKMQQKASINLLAFSAF